MNSKNLIVSLVVVSVASLVVSAFAVFSVARTYSAALVTDEAGETVSVTEMACKPPAQTSIDETTASTESNLTEQTDMTEIPKADQSETIKEDNTENESSDDTTVYEESFILSISGDRLVITDSLGNKIYERIADTSALHPKDRETLIKGIAFSDPESAMEAIYDLIS